MEDSSVEARFRLPQRFVGAEDNVWVEYGQLAMDHSCLSLAHGFPDFPPPKYMTDALAEVLNGDNFMVHQYTRGFGHPRLVEALSKLYSPLISRQINPYTEILVTHGAYEGLYAAIIGHVDEEDEVIIIEPFFDAYVPVTKIAGGIPRLIPLRLRKSGHGDTDESSGEWVLDDQELEAMFNSKTKALILNTPNNPIGKVFSEEELKKIAKLCIKWDVICISDEVYEFVVFSPNTHVRIASLPGMWERTITIGSAGKAFAVTGWKIGWAYGSAQLLTNLQLVHLNSVYTCGTPIQEALAIGLEKELARLGRDDCFFVSFSKEMEVKRNYMIQFLKKTGINPIVPEGGFYIMADWSSLESKVDLSTETDKYKDYRFTKWMTKNIGLMAIPSSVFYGETHKAIGENFIRFCFTKRDDKLQKAEIILEKWRQQLLLLQK